LINCWIRPKYIAGVLILFVDKLTIPARTKSKYTPLLFLSH